MEARNHLLKNESVKVGNVPILKSPPANIPLPPMGWNSWNAFECDLTKINEIRLKSIIDAIVNSGLAKAGYVYFNLDDCWLDPAMTGGGAISDVLNSKSLTIAPRQGPLKADPSRFTNGSLLTLSNYAHAKGLKFGTYLDAGLATCQGYGGSRGYEENDAKTLSEWKVDYLKLDGCYMDDMSVVEVYSTWSNELKKTQREIVFSCSYPAYVQQNSKGFPENFDWETIRKICNLWRVDSDVSARWNSLLGIMDYWANHGDILRKYHGPNGYNDPDMLEIGNDGITAEEGRTQMSLWAILAAPLILGTDVTTLTEIDFSELEYVFDIWFGFTWSLLCLPLVVTLVNPEVIEINQDPLVLQGQRFLNDERVSLWFRRLHDESVAIASVNLQNTSQVLEFYWDIIEKQVAKDLLVSLRNLDCYMIVRDVWSHMNLGENGIIIPAVTPIMRSPYTVPPHGTFLVRVWFGHDCFEQSRYYDKRYIAL